MLLCEVCQGDNFYVEEGLYYCAECNTQSQALREEKKESEFEKGFKSRAIRTSQEKKKRSNISDTLPDEQGNTVHAFNILIIKQVNFLIGIGASPKLKDIVLQLWAMFLQEHDVAFLKKKTVLGPYLTFSTRKRKFNDIENTFSSDFDKPKHKKLKTCMLFGERVAHYYSLKNSSIEKKSSKKKKTSSKMKSSNKKKSNKKKLKSNKETSENNINAACDQKEPFIIKEEKDIEKRKFQTESNELSLYIKKKLSNLTNFMILSKTISFCHLGLLLLNEQILLSDLIRWIKKINFPFLSAGSYMPLEIKKFKVTRKLFFVLKLKAMDAIMNQTLELGKFLKVELPSCTLPNIIVRFLGDLNLPDELLPFIRNLMGPYYSDIKSLFKLLKNKSMLWTGHCLEVTAVSVIVVILKIIFGLDGRTERNISKYCRELKLLISPEVDLFIWDDWEANTKLKIDLTERYHAENMKWNNVIDISPVISFFNKTAYSNLSESNQPYRIALKKVFSSLSVNSSVSYAAPVSSFPLTTNTKLCIKDVKFPQQYQISDSVHYENLNKSFSSSTLAYLVNPTKIKNCIDHKKYGNVLDKGPIKFEYWISQSLSPPNVNLQYHLPKTFVFVLNLCSNLIEVSSNHLYRMIMHVENILLGISNVNKI